MRFLALALLLALTACAAGGGNPSGLAADMQNPQRPQPGPPFPYNSNGW